MRVALFFVVNLVLAALFGFLFYSQGHSAWGIVLRIGAVLVVAQLAYVIWLVAISRLRPTSRTAPQKAEGDPARSDGIGVDTAPATRDGSGRRAS